jgi:hypothetical protein
MRLRGFHQAIIGTQSLILSEKPVWGGMSDETRTVPLDTVDIARMTMAALRSEKAKNTCSPLALQA